jgi:hypothetical protein
MNGSASAPSPATTNGTRRAIWPAMKATSCESRSSLDTSTGHLACGELRSAFQRVGALGRLGLDELGEDAAFFTFGEAGDGLALGLDPQALGTGSAKFIKASGLPIGP